jgi:hypothetical protein
VFLEEAEAALVQAVDSPEVRSTLKLDFVLGIAQLIRAECVINSDHEKRAHPLHSPGEASGPSRVNTGSAARRTCVSIRQPRVVSKKFLFRKWAR